MIRRAVLLSALASGASGFTAPASPLSARRSTHIAASFDDEFEAVESFDPLNLSDDEPSRASARGGRSAIVAASAALTALSSHPLVASANNSPDWGLFEGRTGSLLHPAAMIGMAAFSISTALLGFDWRRQRTIGEEISALKKTMPKLNGAKSISEAIATAQEAEDADMAHVATLRAAMPIEAEIEALTKERKELASAGPRDKHFNQGSLLLFIGTAFAIEGPLNTYARAGKLFPGPHLYAGAGLVVLWSLAAAMVPAMQKGDDTARTVHIGANLAGIGLFVWQVTTGIPILLKVLELTHWP